MTTQEYKNKTITDLFINRNYKNDKDPRKSGVGVKIEGMLARSGMVRNALNYYKDDIIAKTFFELTKTYNDDAFFEKFYGKPNQLDATTILIAKNIGVRNSAKPVDGVKNPKGCLRDELSFASSYKSGYNNVLEPTENNLSYDGMSSDGVSNAVLAETVADMYDKNEVFTYLSNRLEVSERLLLDDITAVLLEKEKKKAGRKKAAVQYQIDTLKLKIAAILNEYSSGYYKPREWSIGEKNSKFKNANYKYLDEEAA
jgi:hypothetical protein